MNVQQLPASLNRIPFSPEGWRFQWERGPADIKRAQESRADLILKLIKTSDLLTGHDVAYWQILLQKSKIERPRKSRESRFLNASTAATLCSEDTKVGGLFCVKRCGPSHRRAQNAPAALENFVHQPKKTFSTVSAHNGHGPMSDLSPLCSSKADMGESSTPACSRTRN